MKFVKQSQLNNRNLKDRSVSVVTDGPNANGIDRDARVVFDVTNSMQMPVGTTLQRPGTTSSANTNGLMRYNTTTDEIEVRSGGVWKRLAYKEPGTIEVQTGPSTGGAQWIGDSLDGGGSGEIYFGPLSYSDVDGNSSLYPAKGTIDVSTPQNLLVYVENVPQLPSVNYILESNPTGNSSGTGYLLGAPYPPGVYVKFNGAVPYGKTVTVIHGFDR